MPPEDGLDLERDKFDCNFDTRRMRDNLKFRRDLPGWAHASGASVVRGLVDDSDLIILFDNMTQYQNKELLEHKVTGHLRRAGAGRALLFCFVAAQCSSRPKWDNPGLPGKRTCQQSDRGGPGESALENKSRVSPRCDTGRRPLRGRSSCGST
jgi:hypothetical protein